MKKFIFLFLSQLLSNKINKDLNLEQAIVILSAFLFSSLTFFSGFGLATVLTPIFILFFPVPVAISLVAVVHFLNNLFKLFLVGKHVNVEVLLKFGLTAIFGAILGSFTLLIIARRSFVINYYFFNHKCNVEFMNFIVGILILCFALLESFPQINKITLNKNLLPVGGLLSGFFGGLSGHQGAFRSIFLVKSNLSSEQFIATGVLIACLVDFTRLLIYGENFFNQNAIKDLPLLASAVASAFCGSYLAKKYMQKITIKLIRKLIIITLFLISTGLISGIIK